MMNYSERRHYDVKKEPTLRFPGFGGEWARCKVKDIATTTIGEFVIKTKQNDSYPYPVYNGGRTNTGFYDKYNNEGNKILVSARGNAGFVNIIKTRYWAGNSCYSIDIIDKNKNNVDFTYYEMKLKENVFIKNQQPATIPSVSKSAVENFELLIPPIQEQTKIGSFLATIDALISETEKELEAYREQKRGMLQKMFPKKGEKVPEIRFPEFTGDWEQRKLKDISSLITKGTTPKDKSGTGEVNFIKVENINDFSGDITGTSKISLEEHQGYLKRSQLQEGDILFSIAGTLGRVTSVNKAILPANTNQALSIIRLKEGNLEYVKTCLKGNVVADFIRRNPTIGAQPNLSLEQVSNLEIEMPSEAEQKKIGEYFSNLDHLITLHQCELDRLLELKKGFMQKMFC